MALASSLRRPFTACTLLAYLLGTTGCHSWNTRQGDIAAVITPAPRESPGMGRGVAGLTPVQPTPTARPDTVRFIRVTIPARGTIEVWNPRVANDSLFGQLVKGGPEAGFPLTDVASFQTKGSSTVKTVLLVGGIAVATYAIAVGIAAASLCSGPTDC